MYSLWAISLAKLIVSTSQLLGIGYTCTAAAKVLIIESDSYQRIICTVY